MRINFLNKTKLNKKIKEIKLEHFDREIDTTGLSGPIPILRTKKALNEMKEGQVLHVIATDTGTKGDIKAFTACMGNELLESTEEDGNFSFYIKKKLN